MNVTVESMIKRELERMGVKTDEDDEQREQESPEQPQYVPVEAVLSAAIGDRPTAFPGPAVNGIRGLNDDRGIARALGADTLEGKPL